MKTEGKSIHVVSGQILFLLHLSSSLDTVLCKSMFLFRSYKGARMFNHLLSIPSHSLTQLIFCTAAVGRIPWTWVGTLLAPWDAPECPMCHSQAEWKVQGFVGWLVLVLSSKRNFRHPAQAVFLTVTIQFLFISQVCIFKSADLSLIILNQLVGTGSKLCSYHLIFTNYQV